MLADLSRGFPGSNASALVFCPFLMRKRGGTLSGSVYRCSGGFLVANGQSFSVLAMKQAPPCFEKPALHRNFASYTDADSPQIPAESASGTLLVSTPSLIVVDADPTALDILFGDTRENHPNGPIHLNSIFCIENSETRRLSSGDAGVELICRASDGSIRPEISSKCTFWSNCNVFRISIRDTSFSILAARQFSRSLPSTFFTLWRLNDPTDWSSCTLADVSENRVFSVQAATHFIGLIISCPVAPMMKKYLGFPLNDCDHAHLQRWSQSSDGTLLLDFEGIHRCVITPLPNRYYLIRFIKIWSDKGNIGSSLVESEIVGVALWDFVNGSDTPTEDFTPENLPLRLIYTNAPGKRFFQDDNPAGKLMGDLCPPMYKTTTVPSLVQAARSGQGFDLTETQVNELEHWKIDPSHVYTIYFRPITPRVVLCAWRDVKEIVHNRAINLRFRTLLNAVPSLCLLAGKPNLSIMYINDAGKHILGLPQDSSEAWPTQTVGVFLPDLVTELLAQPAVNLVVHKRCVLYTADGQQVQVMVSFSTYAAAAAENRGSSAPEFVAVFARELTSEMEVQARLHRELERAEAAASAKSDFLATMSHEIRTPLHGIVGSADLLQGSSLDGWQSDKLAIIQNCSSSLLNIINDILDYSKIDARKMSLESSTFSISDCLDSCLSVVSATIRRKRIDMRYVICQNSAKEFIGDAAKIRQIMLNLIGNAVKFSAENSVVEVGICGCTTKDDGKGTCRADSCRRRWLFDYCWSEDLAAGVLRQTAPHRPSQAGQLQLRFYVRDRGVGMNEQQLQCLFEPFSQARSVGSSKGQGLHASDSGTGLGLSIVKRLLDLMQGGCNVRSLPGRGSCFSILIPSARPQSSEPLYHSSTPKPRIAFISENVSDIITRSEQIEFVAETNVEIFESVDAILSHSSSSAGFQPYDTIFLELGEFCNAQDLLEAVKAITSRPHGLVCNIERDSPANLRSSCASLRREEDGMISVYQPLSCKEIRNVIQWSLTGRNHSPRTSMDEKREEDDIKILVVEDNATNRIVLCQMLRSLGIPESSIDMAEDGVFALEALRNARYHIVLMDIHMPRMSGWEAARYIRAHPEQFKFTGTIIALTAASTLSDKLESLKCMDSFLSKPLQISMLAEELKSATAKLGLHRSFRRQSAARKNSTLPGNRRLSISAPTTKAAAWASSPVDAPLPNKLRSPSNALWMQNWAASFILLAIMLGSIIASYFQ